MAAYGFAGWCIEVFFTGVSDAIAKRDRSLRGETYLWMFPIYGAGGVLLEQLQRGLSPDVPRPLRAVAYVGGIYLTEYTTGLLLRRMLGACPWDYHDRGINVHGLVRLDFAPFWYACALVFEPAAEQMNRALMALSCSTERPLLAVAAPPGRRRRRRGLHLRRPRPRLEPQSTRLVMQKL